MNYTDYITLQSDIRFGKPCIRNTRISVYDILHWLSKGMTQDKILEDFPELTPNDIKAALAYAADRERRLAIAK